MTLGLVAPASAVPLYNTNLKFAPGDLVLTFQKIGSTNTIYANLGNAATLYRGTAAGPDAANRLNITDLSSTLTAAFGAGWASDAGIYAGAVGVYNTDSTPGADIVAGDPSRTLYVSKARTALGAVGAAQSTAWNFRTAGDGAMSTAASNIYASNNVLATNETASLTTIASTSVSQIDNQNPFLSGTIQGAAYGVFGGGVQQAGADISFGTFGAAGSTEFALDLYRMLAETGLDGQVGGATGALLARQSTYEGTITVGTNGGVSFTSSLTAIPEPSGMVLTCLLAVSGLTLRSRRRDA